MGSVMAGQVAGLIKKEQTSKEIIDEIIDEVSEILLKKEVFKWER